MGCEWVGHPLFRAAIEEGQSCIAAGGSQGTQGASWLGGSPGLQLITHGRHRLIFCSPLGKMTRCVYSLFLLFLIYYRNHFI